jgi:hypothetical protein
MPISMIAPRDEMITLAKSMSGALMGISWAFSILIPEILPNTPAMQETAPAIPTPIMIPAMAV